MEDHNGNISIESKVGEGTRFTAFLAIWEEKNLRQE
jgi:signal transduction histidine kinase